MLGVATKADAVRTALALVVRQHKQREAIAWLAESGALADLNDPEVLAAVERLTGGDLLASSDVSRLEAGFAAVNAADHARIIRVLTRAMLLLPFTPEVGSVAVELQGALFARDTAGSSRAGL